ncbi:chemotaxis protein CheA [Sulfitobacter aestuariivivens]|uniref:Chemotaxis protein CheA n=1 Tax=Sulfitobacter aestuariivivens TaxID=2766981 RepID=A0A927HEB7_9RHOB|nr:chemotaxis protein CheA [Sulfitobacter aestuariivivens]MBD3663218.1 chemotaxis protein CheA [Sulfitobacter aestuariivivens]
MPAPHDPMAEIKASFFHECEELLDVLQDGLMAMQNGEEDSETINVIFRAVHSIKGGAGAFGLDGLVRFSHRFETVLDALRAGTLAPSADVLRTLLSATDHLADIVELSRDDAPLPETDTLAICDAIDQLIGDPAPKTTHQSDIDFEPEKITLNLDPSDPPKDQAHVPDTTSKIRHFRITFQPFAELFETGNEPAVLLRHLHALGHASTSCDLSDLPPFEKLVPDIPHLRWDITLETQADLAEVQSVFEFVEGLCHLNIELESVSSADPTPAHQSEPPQYRNDTAAPSRPTTGRQVKPGRPTPPVQKPVVRVELDRVERLVNLVGELVINQAMLSQSLDQSGLSPHSDAMHGVEEFQRLTRDIQDSVMMIRAQPVKALFQRMSRIVREASGALGKDVRLRMLGECCEVDKTVIERLADPLTHLIRNAIDHGLEDPATRCAAGKPAQGTITLSAAHRSGRVHIEVGDDGAGIDRPRVRQRAIEKQVIAADAVLSDSDIDALLFLPGFSTAPAVSDLSGRGVGMDVVRTEIQALGGRVSIQSAPGRGTTFSISLPLTLAVLDGMVISVADETLVLPISLVIETLTLTAPDVSLLRPGCHVVRARDGFFPLIDLGHHLGYRPLIETFEGGIVLLVALADGTSAALLIDDIVDQRQVVIKGLDDRFFRAPGIAAATILGDGHIALILDPSDFVSGAFDTPRVPHTAPAPQGEPA